METETRVRLTPARMSEPKAPGRCSWIQWIELPASVQWLHALLDAQEAKAFGQPCPIENMQDRPVAGSSDQEITCQTRE